MMNKTNGQNRTLNNDKQNEKSQLRIRAIWW